ncbi:CoA ester lyase [Luteimonas sp. RD2P54]|uniref:CoA ester lyase n=1 Tax=Luteimonas endophytica TaxID=3042023 RepID=A0ABT6JAP1_9GAMM|nr:CoA ester lyase [Luteimonas endophytica]MDH5823819.1 CoA ester lyase [Luteimonas endophytica]
MRSKLFVPGSRPELFAKAFAGEADAISLDLEDSVPEQAKAAARVDIMAFLDSTAAAETGKLVIVRINALESPHFDADLAAFARPGVDLINLPKAAGAADVARAAEALEAAERRNGVAAPIALLVNIESARALRAAHEIARAHPRVAGLQLGLGDLFEPLGIERASAANVHAALFALRMAAGEGGCFVCDSAYPLLHDEAGFRAEAELARQLGFRGKSCVHPRQVRWANEVFDGAAPDPEEARRIVAAAAEAGRNGRGAFVLDGKMIDPPYLRRARELLERLDGPRGRDAR